MPRLRVAANNQRARYPRLRCRVGVHIDNLAVASMLRGYIVLRTGRSCFRLVNTNYLSGTSTDGDFQYSQAPTFCHIKHEETRSNILTMSPNPCAHGFLNESILPVANLVVIDNASASRKRIVLGLPWMYTDSAQ